MTTTRYTLSDVRRLSLEAGSHFFERKTLKFFGETMRSYSISHGRDGRVFVVRNRSKIGPGVFEFDTTTHKIGVKMSPEAIAAAF